MKVLQVNCVYKKGSTGKITYDLHKGLQEAGIASVVCYGRGAKLREPGVYKTCPEWYSKVNHALTKITGIMYGGCGLSTGKLISVIRKENPDVVHLQCINGYFVNIYRLVNWLKRHHIKTVLTLHAEFMYTGGCAYTQECQKWKTGCNGCPRYRKELGSLFLNRANKAWKRMYRAVHGFDTLTLVPVSHWLGRQVGVSPIYADIPQRVIHNGINTQCFANCDTAQEEIIKNTYGISPGKRIIMHVTPLFSLKEKGGEYFAALAKKLPAEYQAVVVGYDGPPTDQFVGIRFVKDQKQLAALYAIADVLVITSIIDNYPTVCLEANCCGTPVVGFDVGGVRETIGEGMGEVVPAFDQDALLEKTLYWSDEKSRIPQERIAARVAYCTKERMLKDYLALYREVLDKGSAEEI